MEILLNLNITKGEWELAKEMSDMIKITEAARNYLQKKGKHEVCIEYPNYRTGCECAFVQVPEIFAKKPKAEEGYHKIMIDEINVFLSKSIVLPKDKEIIIDVETILLIKVLKVYGFNTKE